MIDLRESLTVIATMTTTLGLMTVDQTTDQEEDMGLQEAAHTEDLQEVDLMSLV